MELEIKPGTDLARLQPQAVVIMMVAQDAYDYYNCPCIITSGCDSVHHEGSKHYLGLALDFRLPSKYNDKIPLLDELVMGRIRRALGEQFVVILESDTTPGATAAHIHVQFGHKGNDNPTGVA